MVYFVFDNQYNITYSTGLNITDEQSSYHVYNINNFNNIYRYHWGSSYIRIVSFLNENKMNIYGINKIILSEKYYLFDPKTVKKFKLLVDEDYISHACFNGAVEFLKWWLKSGLSLQYNKDALNLASSDGHVNVLEWWLKSGLELQCDKYILKGAFCKGHIHVIRWFMNNNFKVPLKYRLKVYYDTLKTNMKKFIKLQ